jgi:hypothetical protein
MADLTLKGTLNLMGNLTLKGDSGGKVKIGDSGLEALVEVLPSDPAQCSSAPPVILPPPPATPIPPQTTVRVLNSFNKTVKANTKGIVALGMAMQDGGPSPAPMWPGMVLPSTGNPTVTINHIPINVVNDMAIIFPSGCSAAFSTSGQS